MQTCNVRGRRQEAALGAWSLVLFTLALFVVSASPRAQAIPAFARKFGLPCSACHEAWPKLNNFGQVFKDNGYQLGNDKDAPIFHEPAYWPVSFRMTPNWHRENTDKVLVDQAASGVQSITTHGFDLSGLDILTAGTLNKNISFLMVPSADSTGAFHFESVWVRFDNLLKTSWLNVKMGKFELDNVFSEKRNLTLSNTGGPYQIYHYQPLTDVSAGTTPFGIGDNQLGLEVMGHSKNSYTRYSVSVLSSNDGNVGLPTGNSYDVYLAASQAFEAGGLGLQRVGGFAYLGQLPTVYPTSGGAPIPGAGQGYKGFQREGIYGMWYLKRLDITTMFTHNSESKYLATGAAADGSIPLPDNARDASWNGALIETHFTVNPRWILVNRYEAIRMSQQSDPTVPSNLGDIDALTFGTRYYPFMHSRDGFAIHPEYSILRTRGNFQNGTGPLQDSTTSSLFLGFDFIF
jgi:hypothetical protein